MERIKINTMSGSSLDKPLVSAFKSNNATYVVFDNEINGTMGLPIILVSKLENNKLVKINDQNEWGAVKETLRMIIAGNQVDYVAISASLMADDLFFSQLTLPVASFDALKNNYRPNVDNVGAVPNNILNNTNQPSSVSSMNTNVDQPEMSAQPNNYSSFTEASNVSNAVSANNVITENVTPVMPSAPVNAQTTSPVNNVGDSQMNPTSVISNPTPNVEPIPAAETEPQEMPVDFTADKEAFLKACENMFDALVAKFNK